MSRAQFVSDVVVMYGPPPPRAPNINDGFGPPTYVGQSRTDNRTFAARGVSIITTTVEDTGDLDYARGDGRVDFRYILTHRRLGETPPPIVRVYTSDWPRGDGHTDDLNQGRPGGASIYICWEYAKELATSSAEETPSEEALSEAGKEGVFPQPLADIEEFLKKIEENTGEGIEESVLIPLEHVEVEPKLRKASSDE